MQSFGYAVNSILTATANLMFRFIETERGMTNDRTAGFFGVQFGNSTDKTVAADYDGDGKTDVAVFRDGVWYILRSSTASVSIFKWGSAGDIPVPGDYNGDNKADYAIYRRRCLVYFQQRHKQRPHRAVRTFDDKTVSVISTATTNRI